MYLINFSFLTLNYPLVYQLAGMFLTSSYVIQGYIFAIVHSTFTNWWARPIINLDKIEGCVVKRQVVHVSFNKNVTCSGLVHWTLDHQLKELIKNKSGYWDKPKIRVKGRRVLLRFWRKSYNFKICSKKRGGRIDVRFSSLMQIMILFYCLICWIFFYS